MRVRLLLAIALLASACGTSAEPVASVAPAEATTTIEKEAPTLTGAQAIAAAQGTPHILWFWGAN